MKKIGLVVMSLAVAVGLALSPMALAEDQPAEGAAACNPSSGLSGGVECAGEGQKVRSLFGQGGIFKTIVNILLFIIGAVSVIMIIYGGIRYVTSSGASEAVTSAKNTILYAVVGLIISILAYAIVNFVVGNLGAGSQTTNSEDDTGALQIAERVAKL